MEKIVVRMATGLATGLGVASFLALAIGVFATRDYYAGGDYFRLVVIGLPGIVLCSAALILVVRFRLIVHDSYVEKRNFKTVRIRYEAVDRVELYSDGLVLHSDRSKIVVEASEKLNDKIHAAILTRLYGRAGLDVAGEPHLVEAFRKHIGPDDA